MPEVATKRDVKVEHFSDVAVRVVHSAESPPPVVPTPFAGLNYLLLGGFRPGELTYLGARPAVGKSSLASEMAVETARRTQGTLFVSREMTNEAIARRMIAQEGRLNAGALRSGRVVSWDAVTETIAGMERFPIWLTDEAVSVADIAGAIDHLKQPIKLVVVDYLQLLRGPRAQDRRLQIEAVSKELKYVAMSRKVVVLALSSLSRPAQGGDQRPTLASLRESGALEHDADIVLLLHRAKDSNEAECLVAKNRDGRTGTVHLLFRDASVRFDELAGGGR